MRTKYKKLRPANAGHGLAKKYLLIDEDGVRLYLSRSRKNRSVALALKDWMKKNVFNGSSVEPPPAMSCGHPVTEVVSSDEGSSFCGACEREAIKKAEAAYKPELVSILPEEEITSRPWLHKLKSIKPKPPEPDPEPEFDLSGVKDLQTFPHEEFGSVRVVMINGEPWFVAKDVAEALEYSATYEMTKRLDDDEKGTAICSTPGGPQEVTIINESGLYHAVIGSKKPGAVKFRKWVTGKVLLSLRKHTQYTIGRETMSDDELMAKAFLAAQRVINEKEQKLQAAIQTKAWISRTREATAMLPGAWEFFE